MDNCMQWVANNIAADFQRALKYHHEESLSDPEREPFKSLLAARALLRGIQDKLKLYEHITEEDVHNSKLLNACVCLQLGINYIEGEETPSGQKELETCLALLEDIPDRGKTASVSIECRNQLGVVWGNRDDHQKALEFLLNAKAVYEAHHSSSPMNAEQWLLGNPGSEAHREKLLEDLHTHTLFYLAQVYGHIGEPDLSAQYCQDTLGRQLRSNQFDSVEWALNCATLSQYYIGASNFLQGRHCLACAALILQKHVENISATNALEDLLDKLRRSEADLSRCWCKYAISLLQASAKDDHLDPRPLLFVFETLDVAELESSVTAERLKDYESAKDVFLFGQRYVNSAKTYYTKDAHASDYISLVQDHSSLFKALAYFERKDVMKCRMQKRRIDMLKDILREINIHHFLALSRQLMHELAGVYSEMVDLKIVVASNSPSSQQIAKINKLISQAVEWYRKLYDTYVDSKTGKLYEMDNDNLSTVLRARLYMARLVSKTITPVPADQATELQKALEHYEWLVKYCDGHPDEASNVFSDELPICKEMVALLPKRIASLRQ